MVTFSPEMCRFSRKSGRTLSMLGRLPVLPRKRSTMASFSFSAAKWLWEKPSECTVASMTNEPSGASMFSQAKRAPCR